MSKTPLELAQIIFSNGDDYFQSLFNDIAVAKHSIDFETYIFNTDSLGEKVVTILCNAAARGVKVRFLLDGAGTPLLNQEMAARLDQAGVMLQIFHPFPWKLWQWSRAYLHKPFLLKFAYSILKINARNHRKVCIIDGKIAYVGSFNISKVHLSKAYNGDAWRDTGVKISGIDLQDLQNAFNAVWEQLPMQERLQNIFRVYENSDPIIRLNNSRYRRRFLYKNLLRRIAKCQKRIWMNNAYFVPDNFLLKSLKDAAHRGVDVRIILPRKSDVFFMSWASSAFYRSLLKAGVRIFEYLPSMLHNKVLILDNWITVGSSNLNHRSLLHDLEVDINIRIPAAQQQIEQEFAQDLEQSQEVYLAQWYKRPLYQRFLGRLLLYIKYWI